MASRPAPLAGRSGQPRDVQAIMRDVLLALAPGIAVYVWWFGWGVVVQIGLATVAAVACEAFACRLRGREAGESLRDLSALVTAWLLALCVPSLAPWWVIVTGTVIAIALAKHVYGGLGANVFNPAMVGYAALIISFPSQMTQWPNPGAAALSITDTLAAIGTHAVLPDALTGATALDYARTQIHLQRALETLADAPPFGQFAATGWEWIAVAYLLGGVWLLWRGVIRWHIPVAMLAALCCLALAFHLVDAQRYASPLFHLLAGATLLGAFFVATDPVTAPGALRGRLIYGAGIGAVVYVIRTWGGYPDGVAFAVLLMNMAAPAIDHYTGSRTPDTGDERA